MASKRNKGGRPGHKPTPALRRMVAGLAAAGTGQETIASALGITRPTLIAHYRREIDQGGADLIGAAMKALGYLLKRNNFAAVQLVLKCKGGWSERAAPPGAGDTDSQFVIILNGRKPCEATLADDDAEDLPGTPFRH